MNNYEKIKNMSVDEMAEWMSNLNGFCPCHICIFNEYQGCGNRRCEQGIKQWLLKECEE